MSRVRIKERVRGNPDFEVVAQELDRLGIEWSLNAATGKGHPMMHITIGGVVHRRPVACTPRMNTPRAKFQGAIKRWLRERGVDV